MSNLYKFKFIERNWASNKFSKYIILEKQNKKQLLNVYLNDEIRIIDISNNIKTLCDKLVEINIQDWNLKNYYEPMEYLPSFSWELCLETDEIYISCKGKDNYPPNFNKFIGVLKSIGV